jgi:hypothetical protein
MTKIRRFELISEGMIYGKCDESSWKAARKTFKQNHIGSYEIQDTTTGEKKKVNLSL